MFQRLIGLSALMEDGGSSEMPFYRRPLLNGHPDHSEHRLNHII